MKKILHSRTNDCFDPEINLLLKKTNGAFLIPPKETAKLLSCGESTLAKNRCKGIGIPYLKMGRSVRYHISDILKHLKQNKIKTTDGRE